MEVILTFIQRAIMQGIPILFGASGEIPGSIPDLPDPSTGHREQERKQ